MKVFMQIFDLNDNMHILDLGGVEFNWKLIQKKPSVTMINIRGKEYQRGRFTNLVGNATSLAIDDSNFDIVYSNSVIEHVGDWEKQMAFAYEVRRLAPRYYVQTPYRWFFIEPHYITLFIHLLPKALQKNLLPYLSVRGWTEWPDKSHIKTLVDEIELLGVRQMKELFPDAEIRRERFLGLTKSLIAIKQ